MINGVNFQPGSMESERNRQIASRGSSEGVQEAIKVLSLRLPKVVGAQAVAPNALLRGQGAQGNPQIDSMVERVLAKMFPSQGAPQPSAPSAAPMADTSGPQFGGNIQGGMQPRRESGADMPTPNFWAPRIIADGPSVERPPEAPLTGGYDQRYPNMPGVDGGGGFPSAMIAPLPDLRRYLDGIVPAPSVREEQPLI
jgi:hypothetical protein